MGGPLIRLGVALVAAWVGWTLLNAYAGTLFLLSAGVAGWRLWRTAAAMPGQRSRRNLRPVPTGRAILHRHLRPRLRDRTNRRPPPLPQPWRRCRAPPVRLTAPWPS